LMVPSHPWDGGGTMGQILHGSATTTEANVWQVSDRSV
jgi:hypothetical protein